MIFFLYHSYSMFSWLSFFYRKKVLCYSIIFFTYRRPDLDNALYLTYAGLYWWRSYFFYYPFFPIAHLLKEKFTFCIFKGHTIFCCTKYPYIPIDDKCILNSTNVPFFLPLACWRAVLEYFFSGTTNQKQPCPWELIIFYLCLPKNYKICTKVT